MKTKNKLELTWIGKNERKKIEPRILIEDIKKSYGDVNSGNLLIHGDNLLALKSLEQDYFGKIKCIYIDPPFNTGAAFEHYNDNIEHSIWLSLFSERIKILHKLLSDDGSIWINLDDSEASYCKVMCDEIFSRKNYLNEIIVATNKSFGFKSTSNGIFKQANHLLLYCKNKEKFKLNPIAMFIEKEYDPQYKWVFINTDKSEKEWKWINIRDAIALEAGYLNAKDAAKNGIKIDELIPSYAIEHADVVFRTASVTGGALLKRKDTIELSAQNKDLIYRHPNDDMDYMFIGGGRVLYYKERLKMIDGELLPGDLLTDIWNDISVEGLASEGGINFPKGKKPEKLIKRILDLTTTEGDLVLDSFLGSGTTCAVAQKMGRKWIGIEMGDHIYSHCIPRLNNVIEGKDNSGISKYVDFKAGGGYKFYELAPSLLNKDNYGNWIISTEYDADMLSEAMCIHNGFKYIKDQDTFYKQGFSTERDYIFTTTNYVTVQYLDMIKECLNPNESLLICCKSFDEECLTKYKNISIQKIPQSILKRYEFGDVDYTLNIEELEEEVIEDE